MLIGEWKMQNANHVDASELSKINSSRVGSSVRILRVRTESKAGYDSTSHFAIFNFHYSLIILFFATISLPAIAGGNLSLLATAAADEPFRPEMGVFPPADKAVAYSGELTFVDHANRRGSLRVAGEDRFFREAGRPFAMLPYGLVRYHGAPADLRDIPLGTLLHGRFYLSPEPKLSSVPNVNEANHAILLEDEPSFCLREGKIWKLKEVELKDNEGIVVARRDPQDVGEGNAVEERLTVDDTTCFWRGREKLGLDDVIAEGIWPANGKRELGDQVVLLGLTWQPLGGWSGGAFNGFHISDIWMDETAMQRGTAHQTKVHKELIKSRWMLAWVEAVEYGKAGHATVTATLFGGMDPSLYEEFKKGSEAQMGAATRALKHEAGAYGHAHMAIKGPVLDVTKAAEIIPPGSSGIQIRLKVDLVLEGFRPGRIVRIRPMSWPADAIPREEWIGDMEERFPSPNI